MSKAFTKDDLGEILKKYGENVSADDLINLYKLEIQVATDLGVDKRITMLYPILIQIRNKELETLLEIKREYIQMMDTLINAAGMGFQARVNNPISATEELVFFAAVLADIIGKQVTIFGKIDKIDDMIKDIINNKDLTIYYKKLPANCIKEIICQK